MEKLKIGVSGINAVDNPGPGIGVAKSLKEDKELNPTNNRWSLLRCYGTG